LQFVYDNNDQGSRMPIIPPLSISQIHLMRKFRHLTILGLFCFIVLAVSLHATSFAADPDYDLYTDRLVNPDALSDYSVNSRTLARFLLGLPSLPLDMLNAGVDPSVAYLENKRAIKKIDWAWNEIKNYGFYPEARFSPSVANGGLGLKIKGHQLFKTQVTHPHLQYSLFGGFVSRARNALYVDAGANYRIALPSHPNLYQTSTVLYESRPRENFFGIGSNTSLGDESNYDHQELSFDNRIGYDFTSSLKAEGILKFQSIKIGNGHEKGQFRIKEHFTEAEVPGIDGTNLAKWGVRLFHDTRDMPNDPLQGGYEEFNFFVSDDFSGDNFHYLKMQFKAAHFFQLWSDRRVLALHFFAGRSQPIGDGKVPFFDLQRMGGYGKQTPRSETLRGYAYNRFFDQTAVAFTPEYRYKIWSYGLFDADAVFFADIGGVSKEIHSMGFDKLRVGYGTGIRVKNARDIFFSFEVAHGNEGTRYYFRTKAPF